MPPSCRFESARFRMISRSCRPVLEDLICVGLAFLHSYRPVAHRAPVDLTMAAGDLLEPWSFISRAAAQQPILGLLTPGLCQPRFPSAIALLRPGIWVA